MMEFKLYRCAHCGNIAYMVVDKGVPVFCCGEKMSAMVANDTDAALEKHVPHVTREGDVVTVAVGSVMHPMLEEHSIQMIAAVAGDTVSFKLPKPGQDPVMQVTTSDRVAAYEYCNLHGYWKGQE